MSNPYHILLIEDDLALAELMVMYLEQFEFTVQLATSGAEARLLLQSARFHAVLCDIMLPDCDGFSLFDGHKQQLDCPFIFLTALDGQQQQIRGLELGALDYLVKPVAPELLLAKLRALLRHISPQQPKQWQTGQLCLSQARQQLLYQGHDCGLTTQEFDLLWIFVQHLGQVLSRDFLFTAYVGREYDGLDRAIDLKVSRLRKALDDIAIAGLQLKTVHGKGYLLSYSPELAA